MKIGFAQINPTVGDIEGNGKGIIEIIKNYSSKCDLIIFPEMVLTGYPAQDLLFETQFLNIAQNQLEIISQSVKNCVIILAKAAPSDPYEGINEKFNIRFIKTPIRAIVFSCFKLPFAVNSLINPFYQLMMYLKKIDIFLQQKKFRQFL